MKYMKYGKIIIGLCASLLTFSVIIAGLALLWGVSEFQKPATRTQPSLFVINSGAGLSHISANLHRESLINNEIIFKLAARITKADTSLKAGEYEIAPRASMQEIMNQFKDGKTFQRNFTIPEGLTSFEIVNILNKVDLLSGEPITDIPPEGTLLPETYSYQKGEPRQEVLQRIERQMEDAALISCLILLERVAGTTLKDIWDMECSNAPAPLKTVHDVLVLASIVEKETGVGLERKKVAGVFINRLKRGMPLQTDPTVIYALHQGRPENNGKGPLGRRLLRKDLEIDSPYNTYKYPGLPIGPIANPGRAAIEATLQPQDHDYIYFVADGTGGHAFAKTLAGHNANVAKWRKIRRAQK